MAAAAKARGNAALAAKNFDEAIAAYTEAVNALADADRCISINSTWPKGYGRKGAALHALKRLDEAEKAYLAGLEVAEGDAALKSGLNDVLKAKNAEQSRANNPFAKAFGPDLIPRMRTHPKLSSKLEDPGFMMKLRMLQQNPQAMMQTMFSDPDMQEVLSFALGIDIMSPESMKPRDDAADEGAEASSSSTKMEDDVPEPEVVLTEEAAAAKAVEGQAEAAKARGNDLYKQRKFDEALKAYDEAYAIKPDMTYKNNKCACWFEMKEYQTCIDEGRKAIAEGREARAPFETIAKIFVRIGKARLKLGDWDGAIEEYRTAQVENYTKDTERLIKNLELELRKKRAADYVDPEKALEAKERGNGFFRELQFGEAIKEYEEAMKRDPKNPAYPNNLAAALSKIGDFSGAKRACEKALDLDPKYVKAIAKKGDIEFLMKEYHKALDSYKLGLALDATSAACKQGLQKTLTAINTSSGSDKERAAHAMADPEIQAILADPMVRTAINDLSTDPQGAQHIMNDPVMRAKIEKLIAAGVLQVK